MNLSQLKNKVTKHQLLVFFSFLILIISFASNIFNITDDNYKLFDRADEGNVMGRMLYAKEHGIFSKGGLTGQYNHYYFTPLPTEDNPNPTRVRIDSLNLNMSQELSIAYDNYINDNNMTGGGIFIYASQPGGQAITYSILQEILPFGGKINLSLFRLLTITLSALAFALFVGWISRNFGIVAGITTFTIILLSPGIYRFAFNLWWALWSFYIPFITLLLVLERREKKGRKLFDNRLLYILGITVFLKFFFTGGEFITSTLVMTMSPIVFYLLWKENNSKRGIIFFIKGSLISCFSTIMGLVLLTFQNKCYLGTWREAIAYVITCFTRHSTEPNAPTNGATFQDIAREFFTTSAFYWDFTSFKIPFIALLIIISLLSIYLYISNKKQETPQSKKNRALVLTTTISVIAPISWLVFFPLHVLHHQMFDFITWYMPYCLFGFALLGICISQWSNNKKVH